MKSRVLINATILNNPVMTGLMIYASAILERLLPVLQRDERVDDIVLLGRGGRMTELFGEKVRQPKVRLHEVATVNPVRRVFALNRAAGREIRPGRTVFYAPNHHGVVLKSVKQVITIHDMFAMLFPANYRMQHYYFKWYVPRMLPCTRTIITDSDCTARDCRRFYKCLPPTVTVYCALRDDLAGGASREIARLKDRRFFLFVGPNYRYKNADRLIDAFARLVQSDSYSDYRLVFVGGRKPYVDFLRSHLASTHPALESQVDFLGYVSKEELAWLYENAVAAAITTLYEGFGLPALEAMQFDCPVVASRAGSLPEVCAEACCYVDPGDTASISQGLERLASDDKLRADLITRGRENLKRFHWQTAADQVYEVLSRLL